MDHIPGSATPAFDAVYLGILTARGLKPLSRLEYAIDDGYLAWLAQLHLLTAEVTRIARNGTPVSQLVMSADAAILARYCAEFDRQRLRREIPSVIRREAHYFGYPACCAEAYIRTPNAPNDLRAEEQALLFHRPCPGCRITRRLIPAYRAAFSEAEEVFRQVYPVEDVPLRTP